MFSVVSLLHQNAGFDVFNALDLMENQTFLNELKFGKGDGSLQYYLFNWKYVRKTKMLCCLTFFFFFFFFPHFFF